VQMILIRALELFFACMALQACAWRVFTIRHQMLGVFVVFFVAPAILIVSLLALPPQDLDLSGQGLGLICLLHFSLSGAYLFLFTGVAGFSPSIAILEKVARSMPRGLHRDELVPVWFTDQNLSGARRHNLTAGGLLVEKDGYLQLTASGLLIARCFLVFRRFLGLPDVAQG